MATPHRGSSKVVFGDIIVLAARATWRSPNKELLNVLRENISVLNQQRKAFASIQKNLPVVCLYEENKSAVGMVSLIVLVLALN